MAVNFLPPSEVIKQIRATVPSFADRVAGAAQFDAIEDIQNCAVPACFVMLSDNTAETLSMQTSLTQDVFHGFDVMLVLDSVDRRKQEAEEVSTVFKGMLLHALNGWKPVQGTEEGDPDYTASSPLEFIGDSYVDSDRSRYVRTYRFIQDARWCSNGDGVGEGGQGDLGNFDTFLASILVNNTDKALPVEITKLSWVPQIWDDSSIWDDTEIWEDEMYPVD